MSRPSSSSRPRGGTFRPQLETLGDRVVPARLALAPPGDGPAVAALPQSEAVVTTAPVTDFATRTVVFGESTLTRTDDGIRIHLTAEGLPAGVYSGWIAIFAPGAVVTPGMTTPVAAGRVAGHVVGGGGHLTFSVNLKEGEFIGGHAVFPSGSLSDAMQQEIHMVVRYHGPRDPGRIHEQTHTFEPTRASNFLLSIHQVP